MTDHAVVSALVEALIFLEFSDEDAVDPDAGVQTMEAIAGILRRMTAQEREEFTRQLGVLAEQQPETEPGFRRREYIRAIPDYLGLNDER